MDTYQIVKFLYNSIICASKIIGSFQVILRFLKILFPDKYNGLINIFDKSIVSIIPLRKNNEIKKPPEKPP